MNKRFFSFGCSFTRWCWPTWNDYIGLNFDEYHSCGMAGSDNKHILYTLLEVDKEYKLTKDEVRQNISQLKFTIDYWERLLNDWPDDAVHLVVSEDHDDDS